jgi:hypothetical protein
MKVNLKIDAKNFENFPRKTVHVSSKKLVKPEDEN